MTNMATSSKPVRSKESGKSYRRLAPIDEPDEQTLQKAFTTAETGTTVMLLDRRFLRSPFRLRLSDDHAFLIYKFAGETSCLLGGSRKSKKVPVTMLIDARSGWNTDRFQKMARKDKFTTKVAEERCFSVVFRKLQHLHKTADFIAASAEDQRTWMIVLGKLIQDMRLASFHFNEATWLRNNFRLADVNNNGKLSFAELWELLKTLGVQIPEKECKRQFLLSNIRKEENDGLSAVDFDEFVLFFRSLTKRPELKRIMRSYSSLNIDMWKPEDVKEFLEKSQGFEVSLDECKQIVQDFEPDSETRREGFLSVHGFRLLLLSKWGSVMSPSHASTIFQDMTFPLQAYFIHSTHNTYLLGHQLRGNATIEGYIRALKCGARVLELDIWQGDVEPIVTHGHTLVRPTPLVNVVQAIDKYAFISSPYPVILSLENHCDLEYQRKIAHIFLKIFGEKIYVPSSSDQALPSPDQLKNKILLKCKKLSESKPQPEPSKDDDDDDFFDDVYDHIFGLSYSPKTSEDMPVPATAPADIAVAIANPDIAGKKKEKVPIAQELSDIVAIKNVRVKNLQVDATEHPWNGIANVVESRAKEMIEEQYESLVFYTSRHLAKVYPSGKRTGSTNTHPMQYWTAGVQLATMNSQTAGEEMDLNNGLFSINDSCGYILKPKWMRDGSIKTSYLQLREPMLTLRIQVISAQCLPRPETKYTDNVVDPYVTVEVFGFPFDCGKYKTEVVKANGYNPVWEHERFEIKLRVPEIALLRFCVKDYDWISANDFIGQYTAPVMSVTQGYSHIPLETGTMHTRDPSAALFVHVEVEQLISEDQLTSAT